jgi:hypothetical protein
MKLDKFVKEEKLKDYISYIVEKSKDNKFTYDKDVVEPACEMMSDILSAYDEIFKDGGEDAAASYGFKVMVNYVMLSIQVIQNNLQLEKKLKECTK